MIVEYPFSHSWATANEKLGIQSWILEKYKLEQHLIETMKQTFVLIPSAVHQNKSFKWKIWH